MVLGFASSLTVMFVALGFVFATFLEPEHFFGDSTNQSAQSTEFETAGATIAGGDSSALLQFDSQLSAEYDPEDSPRTRFNTFQELGFSPQPDNSLSVGGPSAVSNESNASAESSESASESEDHSHEATEHHIEDSSGEPTTTHTIQPGESLWAIAAEHGTDASTLIQLNEIEDASLLFPGDVLIIPGN